MHQHDVFTCLVSTDVQVQEFLLHSQSDISNSSQGMWLQQTCTLFIQSGIQLLTEFTQHAAVWANTSVMRANFSQSNDNRSQLERAGNSHGEQDIHVLYRKNWSKWPDWIL